jgi:hypothetical protein
MIGKCSKGNFDKDLFIEDGNLNGLPSVYFNPFQARLPLI